MVEPQESSTSSKMLSKQFNCSAELMDDGIKLSEEMVAVA